MERINWINLERIRWCCSDYNISPDILAQDVHIAPTTMTRLMAGQDGITFNQLSKIAEYFGRGVMFFLEDGPVDEKYVHTTQFRTLSNQKPELSPNIKKLIERVEKQREVYLSLIEDIEEKEQQIKFTPPKLPKNDYRNAAHIVRKWLNLSISNNFSSYRKAVEEKGVLVFRSNGYNGKWQIPKNSSILGFALYFSSWPVIVIKKQPTESQQSFTLMHELGHILLHKSSSIDDEGDFQSVKGNEQQANAFAGHLLVPDEFLLAINDAERPKIVSQFDTWLEPQRKEWGVSGEVILRRLLDVDRLSNDQYIAYRKWRANLRNDKENGSRLYRYREPRHLFGDTFVKTVLDALSMQHITLAKASSYLDSLKIKDLHALENFYASL